MREQQVTHSDHEDRDRELFGQIADKYCQKDLHFASRLARKQRLLHTLRSVPSGSRGNLLEIGCGAGFAVQYLEKNFASYCGVDYSDNLISYAQIHNNQDTRPTRPPHSIEVVLDADLAYCSSFTS